MVRILGTEAKGERERGIECNGFPNQTLNPNPAKEEKEGILVKAAQIMSA